MALSATQIANTTAPWLATEVRTFAGPPFRRLLAAGLATIAGWTAPSAGYAATWTDPDGTIYAWTEITSRVHAPDELSWRERGPALTWELQISGENYDPALLGIGLTIVRWRRIWRPDGGWQAWYRDCVGCIVARRDVDDYRAGEPWERTVTGANAVLERIDAPRVTLGPLQIAVGSDVDVTDTLPGAQLAEEANRGEFIGGVANVDAANLVDGKQNTVWISETAPGVNESQIGGDIFIFPTEVFFKPLAGWPAATWWVEFFNGKGGTQPLPAKFRDQDGNILRHPYDDTWDIPPRSWLIVCGNRALFEAYTGGAQNAMVIDASEFNANFHPDPSDGYIEVIGSPVAVAWTTTGAVRHYTEWDAATVNVSTLPANYSIYRYDLTNPIAGGDNPAAWAQHQFPSPGGVSTPDGDGVYVRVTLPENSHVLVGDHSQASTTIHLDGYVGFLGTGAGIVDGEIFDYTGRTAAGLTGVTWRTPHGQSFAGGTPVYCYADGVQQTGYPLTATHLVRVREPRVQHYRVYWSRLAAVRNNTEIGWETDYYPYTGDPLGKRVQYNGVLRTTDRVPNPDGPGSTLGAYLWVRSFLYILDRMANPVSTLAAAYASGSTTMRIQDVTGWPTFGPGAIYNGSTWDSFTFAGRTGNLLTGVAGLSRGYAANSAVQCYSYGRAKLNEVQADVYQAAVNGSGLADLDGADSYDLARWLWTEWLGWPAADLVSDVTDGAHAIGAQQLAIAPVASVLADLARATGCLVEYGTDGRVTWRDDPLWPLGDGTHTARQYTFTGAGWRGPLETSEQAATADYVAVNCEIREAAGLRVARAIWPPPPYGWSEPPPGCQVLEESGFVAPSAAAARAVAESRWRALLLSERVALTVTGTGEWLKPGLRVDLTRATGETYYGVVAAVSVRRGADAWETRVELRRWR